MCLECGCQRANPRSRMRDADDVRAPRAAMDPVQQHRIRTIIERSVIHAIGASALPLNNRPLETLPLARPIRGGTDIVLMRQISIYLGHVACGLTYAQSGRLYNRDRTTAAHACNVIENRRDDPAFDRILEVLEGCVRMGVSQVAQAPA